MDVLGGIMAETADVSGLQFKPLTKVKESVWSPRAQIDKRYTKKCFKKMKVPCFIIQSEATSIDIKNYKVKSVLLRSGEKLTVLV